MNYDLKNKNILISGAGIAGQALAWWLSHYGFNPTVIDRSTKLQTGGYKIDLRGAATAIIRQMGLYQQVQKARTDMVSACFVDDNGKIKARMPAGVTGRLEAGDAALMRGDLSRIIYEDTKDTCAYLFDDSITNVDEDRGGVEVSFEHSQNRHFDLVIGADGIHSNVRGLIFGPESAFRHNLGDYFFATFSLPNYLGLDRQEVFYAGANRVCNVYSTRNSRDAKVLFILKSPGFKLDHHNTWVQKNKVASMFACAKWEVPQLLKYMWESPDFYFDTVNQIHMEQWSSGRVALLGDAAYAPSLASGQGSSLGVVGAYVLAGELYAAGGHYQLGFRRYQEQMHNFILKNQKLGENIKQMVPATDRQLRSQLLMIRLMRYSPISGMIIKKIKKEVLDAANGICLKSY